VKKKEGMERGEGRRERGGEMKGVKRVDEEGCQAE